jgi:hypothetical protein
MADPSTADLGPEHAEPLDTGSTEHVPTPTTTDATAASSPAEKSETKETLLEAVLKAVKPAEDAEEGEGLAGTSPPSEQAPTGPEAKGDGDKGPDLSKDPTNEELATYNKRTRERVEKLLGERNSFRAEAEVTQTLRNFLVTNDIAREDFQLTLDLAAAMRRGDFKAFLEGVGPYVQLATQAMGITLPPDLEQEVRAQKMTFDTAAQMSRDRYARALAEQRATRATQIASSQTSTAQTQHLQRSIENTVASWEAGIRQTDPDYGRKEETVRQLLWSVVNERGVPTSPEHAVEIAKEAYARANRTFATFAPQRPATRAVPSSVNNRAASGARPEPKSMMEAAELGLARARGA